MRIMCFNPRAVHVQGKQLMVADTLFRNPIRNGGSHNIVGNIQASINTVISPIVMSRSQPGLIRKATSSNVTIKRVFRYVKEGRPKYIPPNLHGLHMVFTVRSHQIEFSRGQIHYPSLLKEELLYHIDEGHQALK